MDDLPLDSVLRPTRDDLVAILRQAADPEVPVSVDYHPDSGDLAQLVCVPGWWLWIVWTGQTIDHLSRAHVFDGRRWSYGCDRWPNWEAGADSVPLCPITHLLTPSMRSALEARLMAAPCRPAPELPVVTMAIDDLMDKKYLQLFTP